MRIDLSFWPLVHLWKVTVFRCDREVISMPGFITRAQAVECAHDWRNVIEHDQAE